MGMDAVCGIKAFAPLLEKTVKNIKELGSTGALTGPVSRGDSGVVEKHLIHIEKRLPEFGNVYKALAIQTVRAALEKGSINRDASEKLMRLFE